MDLIIESAFSGSTEPFAPHQFLHAMWSHASHLAGYDQQDAHEFLISLLDGLHLRCGGTPVDCKCIVHRVGHLSPRFCQTHLTMRTDVRRSVPFGRHLPGMRVDVLRVRPSTRNCC